MLGIPDADTAENNSGSKNIVITPVSCEVPNRAPGAPKLSGAGSIFIEPGTQLRAIYDAREVHEEYFCNYEVNGEFEASLITAGLRISARGERGEARAAELPGNRFFVATLYQPQLSSTAAHPHPVIAAFLGAAASFQEAQP